MDALILLLAFAVMAGTIGLVFQGYALWCEWKRRVAR